MQLVTAYTNIKDRDKFSDDISEQCKYLLFIRFHFLPYNFCAQFLLPFLLSLSCFFSLHCFNVHLSCFTYLPSFSQFFSVFCPRFTLLIPVQNFLFNPFFCIHYSALPSLERTTEDFWDHRSVHVLLTVCSSNFCTSSLIFSEFCVATTPLRRNHS